MAAHEDNSICLLSRLRKEANTPYTRPALRATTVITSDYTLALETPGRAPFGAKLPFICFHVSDCAKMELRKGMRGKHEYFSRKTRDASEARRLWQLARGRRHHFHATGQGGELGAQKLHLAARVRP